MYYQTSDIFFEKEARANVQKISYLKKLNNAQWNVMLLLSGVDVYYRTARELSTVDCGYMSSLLLRSDNTNKALSGSKFLGVFKNGNIAYIPYNITDRKEWIYPMFERDVYQSQADSIQTVKDLKLILTGCTLEELWLNVSPSTEYTETDKGQKPIHVALEELGCEYLLIPFGRDGVLQLKLITLCSYKERISKALSAKANDVRELIECDGWKDGMPFIVGVDFNIRRILRGLKQIEKYDNTLKPVVCCLPFQKSTYLKVLKRFSTIETFVFAISLNDICNVFPEVVYVEEKRIPVLGKSGEYIEVPEVFKTKTTINLHEI